MFDSTIRTFISYSHDSVEHKDRVAHLAQRLRDDGVDCTIDQFPFSPPEGWPTWMDTQIREAKFVLIACSKGYHEKLAQIVAPGKGLGVKWEGAIITNELYQNGGMNTKFIPIAFGEVDVQLIPTFLRQTTRYDVSTEDGFELLYRHLTNQPRIEPRPLGSIRRLDPVNPAVSVQAVGIHASPESLNEILLMSRALGTFVVPASEISSSDIVTFELSPPDEECSSFLSGLSRYENRELAVAYGAKAALCTVVSVRSVTKGGVESVTLIVKPQESDYGVSFEMATSTHSADAIAEMRARRILLNERLTVQIARELSISETAISDPMMEVLVRGVNVPISVEENILPKLYESLNHDSERFLVVARLISILFLRLSGAIERVTQLELAMSGNRLSVTFEGVRTKKYSNIPAHRIRFEGSQELVATSES